MRAANPSALETIVTRGSYATAHVTHAKQLVIVHSLHAESKPALMHADGELEFLTACNPRGAQHNVYPSQQVLLSLRVRG